jgi:hypothetical protein
MSTSHFTKLLLVNFIAGVKLLPTKFRALFVDRVKVSRLIEVLEVKLKSDVKIKSLSSLIE